MSSRNPASRQRRLECVLHVGIGTIHVRPTSQPWLTNLRTKPQPIAARGDEHDPHSLDTEDDATDIEEDARTLPNANAFVRQGVFVAPSSTVGWWKGGGLGLFSGVRMRAGDLIGYYTGEWRSEAEYGAMPEAQRRRLDEYAVTVEPELERGRGDATPMVVSPPMPEQQPRPDPASFPLAFANEATRPLTANAAFTLVQMRVDDVRGAVPADQVDGEWLGLAVYACRDIGRNREILVHYGDTFPRGRYGYVEGEPCRPLEAMQLPVALGLVPVAALTFVEGSASDHDSSDSSYVE